MARSGPKKLPSNVLALRGAEPEKVEERRAEELSTPAIDRLPPPEWLSREAKALWRAMVPKLLEESPGLVAERDGFMLGLYFEHLAVCKAASASMRGARGWLYPVDQDAAHGGRNRKHPGAELLRQHSQSALSIAREFGFTPSARVGLHVGPMVEPDDPDDDDDDLFD